MKKILLVIFLLPLFITRAFADDVRTEIPELSALEENLSESERDISGEMRLDGSYDVRAALTRLIGNIKDRLTTALKSELQFVVSIISLSIFCSLAVALCPKESAAGYIDTACCCALAYMLSGSLDGIIQQAISSLNQLSDYSRAALPAVFTASAACGALSSAPIKYAAACFAIEFFMSLARDFILPLIYAYLAVALSSSIFENPVLGAVSGFCKKLATYLMTGFCIIFSFYIGVSGIIAGSADAAAVKAAKTIISGALPVVGGIISDSASAVLASASLIKNSAGVFSLIAICALCAGPFAALSIKAFLYKLTASAVDMLPGNKISRLLSSLGSVMSLLLGLVGSCGIMLFVSVMSALKVVGL